jgi:hypothetical protein
MGRMPQEAKAQSNVWDTLTWGRGPEYGKVEVRKEFGSYGRRENTY